MTFNYIVNRLKEVSTWQGIITMLTGLGVIVSPELRLAIVSTGVAVFGLVSIILRERNTPPVYEIRTDGPAVPPSIKVEIPKDPEAGMTTYDNKP